jgi:hypothetical protein
MKKDAIANPQVPKKYGVAMCQTLWQRGFHSCHTGLTISFHLKVFCDRKQVHCKREQDSYLFHFCKRNKLVHKTPTSKFPYIMHVSPISCY